MHCEIEFTEIAFDAGWSCVMWSDMIVSSVASYMM